MNIILETGLHFYSSKS